MDKEVKKVMVIGLDAPITKSVEKYVKEGALPVIAKLMENGTWAENCLVPHPTITPPNWTTIVTGSWPGTHGITCFHIHKPGMKLDETYQAFSSDDCQSEYIWQAAEKVGKKSIIVNYPTTWPPTIKEGIQIAGAGLHVNDWRIDKKGQCLPLWGCLSTIADEQLFTTEEYPLSDVVEFKPATDWENLPSGKNPLEAKIKVGYRNCKDKVEPQEWFILVQGTGNDGYDTVSVTKSKNGQDILFTIKPGQWSEKIKVEFTVNGEKKKSSFMAKLLELSSDAKKFKLYFTPFCQLDGWAYPEEITQELENIEGLPFRCMEEGLHLEWYDVQTYIERIELENKWLAAAVNHLLKNYSWDMFFMHAHAPDHAYHGFINKLDPSVCKDKTEISKYQKAELDFYQSLDRMIGKIIECANEQTLIIIVSDHGATPTQGRYDSDYNGFSVQEILDKEGLTVYKEEDGQKKVDWSKTKAITQRSVYIYINLKGRDPQGIVEPGQEYEKLQDKIINLLYDYTDPKNGTKPIAFALRKQDARILGLYGERIGDVVYGVTGPTSGEHGRQIPTAEYGMGSLKGLLILSGPNIKKGHRLQRNVWLTDIVPTICYLMKIPVPQDTEGAIIYQALEEPDFMIKELETLRKNYQRAKNALEANKALTHEYR